MSYVTTVSHHVEGTGWIGDVWQPTTFRIECANRGAARILCEDLKTRGFEAGIGSSTAAFQSYTAPGPVFAARAETKKPWEIVALPAGSALMVTAPNYCQGRFWRIRDEDDYRANPQVMLGNSQMVVGPFDDPARFELIADTSSIPLVYNIIENANAPAT